MTTCDACGCSETDPALRLAWTVSVERGRRQTFCVPCSRQHLRAMEGGLDQEWW